MNKIMRKLAAMCLTVVLCLGNTAFALGAETGSLTVRLQNDRNEPVNGLSVSVCQVAALETVGYVLDQDFEGSGLAINLIVNDPSPAAAKSVAAYVKDNGIPVQTAVSADGKAVFSALDKGIWIVMCGEGQDWVFEPYFVFLPMTVGGSSSNSVESAPKLGDGDTPGGTDPVIPPGPGPGTDPDNPDDSDDPDDPDKPVNPGDQDEPGEFDDSGSTEEPESPKPGKLPQTGQLWWPVLLIAIAGGCMVILGVLDLKEKHHGKK